MKHSSLALLGVMAIAAACDGSSSEEMTDAADDKTGVVPFSQPSDEEILSKVYNTEYHAPDGFFVDERVASTTRSYTVHHVLDESNSYEMCSDDLSEAQAWEQLDNESRVVGGFYVSSYENDRYFEFVRELDYTQDVGNVTDPTSPGYARVFKCDYTNRNGVDRALLDGYSGTLGTANLDNDLLKDFTEYLWQFRFFNVSRKVVLESYSTGPLDRTLLLAFVVNQGNTACDRIDVIKWRFSGDSATGEVSRRFEVVHSFDATNAFGVPNICD